MKLEAGQTYNLALEFMRLPDTDFAHVKLMFGRVVGAKAIEAAAKLAAECDAALVFVGMPEGLESEGDDLRQELGLPGKQDELVRAVARANPRTAVIVNAGSPVAMPWLGDVPAAVFMYYPGLEGGHAVARVLTGQVNPSGKLTSTFPVRLEDAPASINLSVPGARQVHYGEGVFVGYRYYDTKGIASLFPFGHGLSYTQFAYEELQVPATAKIGESVNVAVTVRNTGDRAGKEIVQLYVADAQSSLPRPVKELKGFAKVALEPGASETLTFTLDRRTFTFYDPVRCDWIVEPGEFEILVGSTSQDIRARGKIALA
jgi:beta-glucosidase